MPDREGGDGPRVGARRQRAPAQVDVEDLPARLPAREADRDLAVEAPGAHERRVEVVEAVGQRQHDHRPRRRGSRIRPSRTAADRGSARARPTDAWPVRLPPDRVDLVDVDDRGRGLARGREQRPDPLGAEAAVHLDELRAGGAEERHAGLAGDGPGEQRLPGAGRAVEDDPARQRRRPPGRTGPGRAGRRRSRPPRRGSRRCPATSAKRGVRAHRASRACEKRAPPATRRARADTTTRPASRISGPQVWTNASQAEARAAGAAIRPPGPRPGAR